MKKMRRVLSAFMVAVILFTTVPVEGALAQNQTGTELSLENDAAGEESAESTEQTEETENTEETEITEETEDTEKTENTEITGETETTEETEDTGRTETTETTEGTEDIGKTETTETTEKNKITEDTETEETEDTEETEGTEEEEIEYLIQYLLVNENNVALNQKQQVVLGIGCEKAISEAVLQYHNQNTGEVFQQYFTEIIDNAILFEMLFDNENQVGAYQLDSVTFKVDGEEYTETFAAAGIEVVFGVNQGVESNPDAVVDDGSIDETEGVDIDVVRIDENGDTVSETSIEEAIDNASAGQSATLGLDDEDGIAAYSTERAGNVVVVLDPGHDNTHSGAQANGLKEETLNLKIAAYCKEELEQYQGVTVYMVRALDGSCPYPGTTSGACNEQRVAYAKSVGADIYVSIHNNSASSASAHGAEVYYPNSNYNPWVGTTGQGLAQVVENHLVALGLYDRGIKIKDAQQDKYPDGSAADYYGVIRNSKLAGIPAIIIEHAFVTSGSDVNNFLGSDEKLKMLGVADATAIAEYYGLTKNVDITVTAGNTQVTNVNNVAGTALMSVAGVTPNDKVRKVSFAVWSKSDQSDLVWYDVTNNGTGTYQATLNISRHGYNVGTYYVHAYAYDVYGKNHYIGGNTCAFSEGKAKLTASGNKAQTVYTLTASNVVIPGGINKLQFAVWSAEGGQDDLIWYTATQNAAGNYVASVPISNHRTEGTYYADAYVVKKNSESRNLGRVTFKVTAMSSGTVAAENIDRENGQFDVRVKGITSASGISRVEVPVWSKADQSDIYWYPAVKQSDGSYVAHVDIARHGYAYTTYTAHAYVLSGNGVYKYIGGKSVNLTIPAAKVTTFQDAQEKNYTINVTELRMKGTPKKVSVAVWSASGGQDDLRWYDASATALAGWSVTVPISNHKTAGTYYGDVYVTDASGTSSTCVGRATFEVSAPTTGTIKIANQNEGAGTFDVVISGVSAKAGISQISVPVWSKSNQSDIYWYTAAKQSNGTYKVQVDLAKHDYNYGKYNVDVYATAGNGIQRRVCGTKVTMNQPNAVVKATGNTAETKYTVSISNAGLAGGIKSMSFAVWSTAGGQDDLKWYDAKNVSRGIWTAEVLIADHRTAGSYCVDAYAVNAAGKTVYMGRGNFTVSDIPTAKVTSANKNEGMGQFQVVISGVSAKAGVSQVSVPVWSKSDQSDIYWYTAEKQPNGTYVAQVDLGRHKYNYGTYTADVYVTSGNGIQKLVGKTKVTMNQPTPTIKAIGNSSETRYTVTVTNAGLPGGIKSVSFAVWSASGGQDDLRWYDAKNTSRGTWTADITIANHNTVGLYYVDVYAKKTGGGDVRLGRTTFQVSSASAGKISIANKNEGTGQFNVVISSVSCKVGVAKVEVPVWTKSDQSDIYWYTAAKQPNGSYVVNVNIANHSYNYGTYKADVYAMTGSGVYQRLGGTTTSMNAPKAQITVAGNAGQTRYTLTASNVGISGGVKSVSFAVWSAEGGQDDLRWYDAANTILGGWTADVKIADHKTAGTYHVDAYAQSANGSSVCIGRTTFKVDAPTVSAVKLINYNEADGTFGVQATGVKAASGISSVSIAVWSASNQSDLVWYDAFMNAPGSYQIGADIRNHQNNTGTYYAHVYVTDNNGVRVYGGGISCSMINVTNVLHPLMGSTSVTVQQMAEYYKASAYYPAFYANTEAPTIEAFCKIYVEECQAEGVKAEVAFCQAMKETGFLKFGGNVSITQYNFAGLGSTGPGVAGESYPNVRTGIRAQIQHLKAYGCTAPLNQACVDTRFGYVTRNSAPYVEWLGIQENPYGKGWATAKNYGYDIVRMVNNLKAF